MLYLTIKTMEININCDLGEKSKHHSNKHDPDLLKIVNSANHSVFSQTEHHKPATKHRQTHTDSTD